MLELSSTVTKCEYTTIETTNQATTQEDAATKLKVSSTMFNEAKRCPILTFTKRQHVNWFALGYSQVKKGDTVQSEPTQYCVFD